MSTIETFDNDTATWCDIHAVIRDACRCPFPEEEPQAIAPVVKLNPTPEQEEQNKRESEIDALLANVRNGTWLDAQEFPPLEWAIPGVIPEGFTLLAGAPKVGKSWFILSLCLALASGGKALNALDVQPGEVFYLALEDGDRRLQDRIRQLVPGEQIPPNFNYITTVTPGSVVLTIEAWLQRHPNTRLIVLDTLGKVMPPARAGETTYQRDYNIGSRLKAIIDQYAGLSVVVVHHDRKAESGDFVDSVSGTNGIAGSADTIVLLARDRHTETGYLNVTGRDVEENEYELARSITGTWTLTGGTLEEAKEAAKENRANAKLHGYGDKLREVVAHVNSREATTPKELTEHLGITAQDAAQYLHRAVNYGLIDKAARGTYTPLLKKEEPLRHPVS